MHLPLEGWYCAHILQPQFGYGLCPYVQVLTTHRRGGVGVGRVGVGRVGVGLTPPPSLQITFSPPYNPLQRHSLYLPV